MVRSLIFVFFLGTWEIAFSTIYVVDNTSNFVDGSFSNFSDAHDLAVTGDTIHVVPSFISYGSVTITKNLKVFGSGFSTKTDNGRLSTFFDINLNAGSDGTGLHALYITNSVKLFTSGSGSLTDIFISNCYIDDFITINNSSAVLGNLNIQGCILGSDAATNETPLFINPGSHTGMVVIKNNIIYGASDSSPGTIHLEDNGVISNNIFVGDSLVDTRAFSTLSNCQVSHNVFFGRSPGASTMISANTFSGNLTYGATVSIADVIAAGNSDTGDNLDGVDPEFVNLPFGHDWLEYYDPSTSAGSPNRLTTPFRGVFTGNSIENFVNTGKVLPYIESLEFSRTVFLGDTIKFDLTVKGGLIKEN